MTVGVAVFSNVQREAGSFALLRMIGWPKNAYKPRTDRRTIGKERGCYEEWRVRASVAFMTAVGDRGYSRNLATTWRRQMVPSRRANTCIIRSQHN